MSPEWNDFFTALAGATATIFAVLLATLQLTAATWRTSELKRAAAVVDLVELFVPLVAALVALMPGEESWRVGFVIMGLAGGGSLFWYARLFVKHERQADDFDWSQLTLLPLSAAVYGALLIFSVIHPAAWPIYVVAGLSIWLLFSGASEAWYLLYATGRNRGTDNPADSMRTAGSNPAPDQHKFR